MPLVCGNRWGLLAHKNFGNVLGELRGLFRHFSSTVAKTMLRLSVFKGIVLALGMPTLSAGESDS